MTLDAQVDLAVSPADALSDSERALQVLRAQGADRRSPVDFHYMEALARRMNDRPPAVRRILDSKLAAALAAYTALSEEPEVGAAHRVAAVQPPEITTLGELVQSMAQPMPEAEATAWASINTPRTELKSVRQFRNTWSKLSAQKQVSQALGQAPKNAGPINSHMLVLRSLELMRDISPDYLSRFVSYADTLLCLDQADLSAKAAPTKPLASAKPKARAPAKP